MPTCRACGARISKFDKDRCPICGEINPLKGVNNETIEITSKIDLSKPEFKTYKPKEKKVLLILGFLLGFTGAPYFYICKYIKGLIFLFVNLFFICGLGSLLCFTTPLSFYSYLIFGSLSYIFSLIFTLLVFNKPNIKDGNGEFIR